MSTEEPTETPADEPDENVLIRLYRRHVGEPGRHIDIYLGFGLFFGGVALGFVGLVLFLAEPSLGSGGPLFWLREVAFSVGALGLPTLLLGVVVLLPVDRRAVYVAASGAVVTLAAIVFFVAVYPHQWNVVRGPDYSTQGVTLYAAGLTVVVAATGAALVSYHVERAAPGTARPAAGDASAGGAAGAAGATDAAGANAAAGSGTTAAPEVTEEQVRRDIEDAMKSTEISWGGVRKTDHRRIRIRSDESEADIDRSSFDDVEAKTTRSEGSDVDDAVASLRGLRTGEVRAERSEEGVDDQAAALRELREKQRAEREAAADEGALGQVKRFLGFE